MKRFLQFIKTQKLALGSVIFIIFLYLVMIFAEFFAPYDANQYFESGSFHPVNVEFSSKGLIAREFRVLNPINWQYAKVKGNEFHHKISFFVHGSEYKLLGFIPCDIHLFGVKNQVYPVFLFGADNLGRDLFSRIVYGSRISLTIGFVAAFISLFLAILLGGLAGYYGGATDWSIMRFAEFFMLIPATYLILFLRSLLNTNMDSGKSYMIITIILSLVGWPGSARTIRGIVHSVKREDFILNSGLEGIPSSIIIFFQIIPQISSLLIVSIALSIPGFIMQETMLSYLGLGISDPAVSWGSLINKDISTLSNLQNYPWLLIPVWLLLLVTLAFNFFGDALRDYFDPYYAVFKTFKKKKVSSVAKDKKESSSENLLCDANCKNAMPMLNAMSAEKLATSSGSDLMGEVDTDVIPNDESETYSICEGVESPVPLLYVKDLFVKFAVLQGVKRVETEVVKGISYKMNRGEILGIVGESGSGKSVSVTAIPSLLPKNTFVSGSIFYNGIDLLNLNSKELIKYRGKKVAFIFQEPSRSFDPLQSIGNVFFEIARNLDPFITKQQALANAEILLNEVGIQDAFLRLQNFPHQFSGGQLQRISIALALAQNCELLIADEPTTALDVTIQAQIVDLLLKLKEKRNLSIIFISHNIELVAQISDNILVMYKGKIVEQGSAKDIYNNPQNEYTKLLLSCLPKFGTHYTTNKLKTFSTKKKGEI